jgi:hypothetical protein
MENTCWKISASIALMLFSHTALAALGDGRTTPVRGSAHAGAERLAQAGAPAASPTASPQNSNVPQDQSSPASATPASPAPSGPVATEVARPAPTVPGCAVRYMAAELGGKLKGRKWNEFRQQECGPSTTVAVFPSAIAPKYAGEKPDKARTLTCADQFSANKATNGNGGMKWIERSGGYYSECVVRLKG